MLLVTTFARAELTKILHSDILVKINTKLVEQFQNQTSKCMTAHFLGFFPNRIIPISLLFFLQFSVYFMIKTRRKLYALIIYLIVTKKHL